MKMIGFLLGSVTAVVTIFSSCQPISPMKIASNHQVEGVHLVKKIGSFIH
jgi:hypothetical protein